MSTKEGETDTSKEVSYDFYVHFCVDRNEPKSNQGEEAARPPPPGLPSTAKTDNGAILTQRRRKGLYPTREESAFNNAA